MRILKILMILTGAILSSACSSVKYKNIHVALESDTPCVFEKFTEAEKDSMIEPVGKKIHRNQQSCFIRYDENADMLNAHNQAHQDK